MPCSPASEGLPSRTSSRDYYGSRDPEVDSAINRRQAVHEEELLAEDELGRRVLELRGQKENLLDVVWLATSPSQIRDLWTRFCKLLGDEPSAMEREALSIPPADEEV